MNPKDGGNPCSVALNSLWRRNTRKCPRCSLSSQIVPRFRTPGYLYNAASLTSVPRIFQDQNILHFFETRNIPSYSNHSESRVHFSGFLAPRLPVDSDMAPPDMVPLWWDRDVDDQGKPIRADVRQAAQELWPQAVGRVRRALSDAYEAAELMEATVLHVSRYLDRVDALCFASNVRSLVSLHFSQELKRLASRLGRVKFVGDGTTIEQQAVVTGWADRIHRQLDFARIIGRLKDINRTVVLMRMQEHDWNVIGAKLGILPATVRRAFWKDLRDVLARMGSGNGTGRKGPRK